MLVFTMANPRATIFKDEYNRVNKMDGDVTDFHHDFKNTFSF